MDSYPYIEAGDEITCDLTTGVTGLHGEVLDVTLNEDGRLRALTLRQEPGGPALHIHGEVLALWRLGKPNRQQVPVPQGIAMPGQLPAGFLRAADGRG